MIDQAKEKKVFKRNEGIELDISLLENLRINRSAAERRANTLGKRRSLKHQWQAAWLIRAITCLDLTTLAGDDTPGNVRRLCAKARFPVRRDILSKLDYSGPLSVAAVCVYHNLIATAYEALTGSGIPIAAVSTGFPAGQIPHVQKLEQITASVNEGAEEIDVVISRPYVIAQNWSALYEEVQDFRHACGDAHLKVILATGELPTLRHVAQASHVSMMAGADFIKTSTGKEKLNATIPVGLVMTRAIRHYYNKTGFKVGFKAAGGIRTAKDALTWLILIKEELGETWMNKSLFRFGASSLLNDIERQLEHLATGRYSAGYRHPMA